MRSQHDVIYRLAYCLRDAVCAASIKHQRRHDFYLATAGHAINVI